MDKEPPGHYIERVRQLGESVGLIFTDHAIKRCYGRRVSPYRVILTVENPDRVMDSPEGKKYSRLIRRIGKRKTYVSIVVEGSAKIIVSVGWR